MCKVKGDFFLRGSSNVSCSVMLSFSPSLWILLLTWARFDAKGHRCFLPLDCPFIQDRQHPWLGLTFTGGKQVLFHLYQHCFLANCYNSVQFLLLLEQTIPTLRGDSHPEDDSKLLLCSSVREQAHDKNARLELQRMLNISEAEHLPLHFTPCSACPPFTRRVAVLFSLVLPCKFSKSPSYSPVIAVLYVKLGRVVVDPLRGRLQAAAHRNYENLQLCSATWGITNEKPFAPIFPGKEGSSASFWRALFLPE